MAIHSKVPQRRSTAQRAPSLVRCIGTEHAKDGIAKHAGDTQNQNLCHYRYLRSTIKPNDSYSRTAKQQAAQLVRDIQHQERQGDGTEQLVALHRHIAKTGEPVGDDLSNQRTEH